MVPAFRVALGLVKKNPGFFSRFLFLGRSGNADLATV